MTEKPDFSAWSCPLPLRSFDQIVMAHGGGGQLSAELVEHLFLPAFGSGAESELLDAADVELPAGSRLVFSTDSYVVRPLFFPGGNIGDLAINGTINDVAMRGAVPLAISAGFILEEGLEMGVLGLVAESMGQASTVAGCPVVTGDTKVVERGKADGLYINTAGVGAIPAGVDIRPSRAQPGDAILVSGTVGDHGVAVMSQREGLEFGTEIRTDSAPLAGLVAAMLAVSREIHVLRDPTRGGVAASLCEIAAAGKVGIEYDETAIPVLDEVAGACSFLGLDPMHIANEGKLVAFVAADHADSVLDAMHEHPLGARAVRIGTVVDAHPGVVAARTRLGATRVVDLPLGEQLPRIC